MKQSYIIDFLGANNVPKVSDSVMSMLISSEPPSLTMKQVRTTGGFLRSMSTIQSTKQAGGFPSEYFGKASGSYHSDVPTINYTDATPRLTRLPIPSTYEGGGTQLNYKFLTVRELQNYYPQANKVFTAHVNAILQTVYLNAIKDGKMTKKSLISAFNGGK
jgi:hypothetical protein